MNKSNNWEQLLSMANEKFVKTKKEIRVVSNETDCYDVFIVERRSSDDMSNICFSEDLNEDEVYNAVIEAITFAQEIDDERAKVEALRRQLITFRIVSGGTHDMPALIYAITSVDLYFHDFDTDSIEKVTAESIDHYQGRNGEFCVHQDDYEIAEQQIYEHDEFEIEH